MGRDECEGVSQVQVATQLTCRSPRSRAAAGVEDKVRSVCGSGLNVANVVGLARN